MIKMTANPSTNPRQDITIVIPAYNEAEGIARVIHDIKSLLPDTPLLVVDDGSEDNTADVALLAGAAIIRHPYNKGNGAAVKTALRHVKTEKIVIIDADGQHPPEMLSVLINGLKKFDLVVGARTAKSDALLHRDVGNLMLRTFAGYLSGHKIPDLTSGFRAFDRAKALEFIHLYPNGFSFPSTCTMAFISAGYNVAFEPITATKRAIGTHSKIRPLRDGFKFGLLIIRIATMINPLRVFFPSGFLAFLIGISWTIRNVIVHGQFSVAGTLFVTLGIEIIFFGIVVDQLAALRLKIRD